MVWASAPKNKVNRMVKDEEIDEDFDDEKDDDDDELDFIDEEEDEPTKH